MVLLVVYPVGVDAPQHPLRCHLIEAAAAPCLAGFVGHDLQLEAVAEFVGQRVELLVLYAVGTHPQRPDEVVIGAAVGRAVERVVDHHHHLVTVAETAGQRELQRVAEIMIEVLQPHLQVAEIETHGLSLQCRCMVRVVAEALLPEEDQVLRLCAVPPRPFRPVVVEIEGTKGVGEVDKLLGCDRSPATVCLTKGQTGTKKNYKT